MNDFTVKHGLYDFEVICDETNNSQENIDNNEKEMQKYLDGKTDVQIFETMSPKEKSNIGKEYRD
jgi:hypothetical protein